MKGETAVLPAHAVRRDWIYSRDIAAGLLLLLDAKTTRHAVYNLSAGGDWGPVDRWCARLKEQYSRFDWRGAVNGEAPNIGYTDRDRCPLDIGRMIGEFGFSPRSSEDAFTQYLEWLARTPDAYG